LNGYPHNGCAALQTEDVFAHLEGPTTRLADLADRAFRAVNDEVRWPLVTLCQQGDSAEGIRRIWVPAIHLPIRRPDDAQTAHPSATMERARPWLGP